MKQKTVMTNPKYVLLSVINDRTEWTKQWKEDEFTIAINPSCVTLVLPHYEFSTHTLVIAGQSAWHIGMPFKEVLTRLNSTKVLYDTEIEDNGGYE